MVETTELTERDAGAEALFLGLRLMRGVDLREHRARFGADVRAETRRRTSRVSAKPASSNSTATGSALRAAARCSRTKSSRRLYES